MLSPSSAIQKRFLISNASKVGTSPLRMHLIQALRLAELAARWRTPLGLLGCKWHLTERTFSSGSFSIFSCSLAFVFQSENNQNFLNTKSNNKISSLLYSTTQFLLLFISKKIFWVILFDESQSSLCHSIQSNIFLP